MTVFGGDIIYAADMNAATIKHACKLAAQTNQSIPDGSDTVISTAFGSGSEEYDTDGWHSTTVNPSRVTVDRDGLFEVTAHLVYSFNTTWLYGDIAIRKNGTASWRSGNIAPTTANNVSKMGGTLQETIAAVAGDYFEMSALQNSTADAAQTINTGGAGTRFTVRYIGPTS